MAPFILVWIFVMAFALGHSREQGRATEGAIKEGFAEYNSQTGEVQWLDTRVCRVVLRESSRCEKQAAEKLND